LTKKADYGTRSAAVRIAAGPSAGLVVAAAVTYWRGGGVRPTLPALSVALMVAAMTMPGIVCAIGEGVRGALRLVRRIASGVILFGVYFLVVTPLAAVARLMGKSFLEPAPDPSRSSYWNRRDKGDDGDERWERPY
jgi:hypothetical protein